MPGLLDALLIGGVPESLRGSPFPRRRGAWVDDIGVNDEGYPDEDLVDAIRLLGAEQARDWLVDVFPGLAASIPYARTASTEDGDGDIEITFSTGGWSGAESFIHAVTDNFWLRQYLACRLAGGHYVFQVPCSS